MKKAIAFVLCLVLVLTLGLNVACAAQRQPTRAELATLNRLVDAANLQIKVMVLTAQLTPWNDIAWLQRNVDLIVRGVQNYARRIGATVVCEYTYYYIDGHYVAVDPLRVINLSPSVAKGQ